MTPGKYYFVIMTRFTQKNLILLVGFDFAENKKLSDKNQTKLELVSCLSNDWNTMPLVSSEEKAQIHLQTLTICTQEAG